MEDQISLLAQLSSLKAFSRALTREAHVLSREPGLLWQQMYNRLQWQGETVEQAIAPELALRSAPGARPWMRVKTHFRESEALIRILEGHTNGVNACTFSMESRDIISAG
jgi:hypothetical protein